MEVALSFETLKTPHPIAEDSNVLQVSRILNCGLRYVVELLHSAGKCQSGVSEFQKQTTFLLAIVLNNHYLIWLGVGIAQSV
jgi:hypothetical protein